MRKKSRRFFGALFRFFLDTRAPGLLLSTPHSLSRPPPTIRERREREKDRKERLRVSSLCSSRATPREIVFFAFTFFSRGADFNFKQRPILRAACGEKRGIFPKACDAADSFPRRSRPRRRIRNSVCPRTTTALPPRPPPPPPRPF